MIIEAGHYWLEKSGKKKIRFIWFYKYNKCIFMQLLLKSIDWSQSNEYPQSIMFTPVIPSFTI